MRGLLLVVALLRLAAVLHAGELADLATRIRESGLDPEACYRVREVNLFREDLRLYLTEGYLIFGRPVNGVRLAAVFVAETEGGDAEVLLFPPRRSERLSLASYTRTPNLNEHFTNAVFIFTDNTGEELLRTIGEMPVVRRVPEVGAGLRQTWEPVVENLQASFIVRLVGDLLLPQRAQQGAMYVALQGRTLGNFDVIYDPNSDEQFVVGQVSYRSEHPFFNVWTAFPARSVRSGERRPPTADMPLGDFRIEATLEPDLSLRAVTKARFTIERPGARALTLDISQQMRVLEAKIDHEPAEVLQRESWRANLMRGGGNEYFVMASPRELAPGPHEIEIHHEGSVISEAGANVYYVGARGNWYPNRGHRFSDFDVTFRYPRTLDLVAAGTIISETEEGDWRITRRQTTAPFRLYGFNLGNYERTKVTRAGSTVEICANRQLGEELRPRQGMVVIPVYPYPWSRRPATIVSPPVPSPPTTAVLLRELAARVSDSFEFMSGHFGPPPWQELTVAPIPGAFGQGFPGLVYLSTLAYFRAGEGPLASSNAYENVFFTEILHAHETAHQWWGNTVTIGGYQDEWLMEALADYCALLFLEKRRGRDALDYVLGQYRSNLLAKDPEGKTIESFGPIIWGTRLRTSLQPRAWRTILYEKGAWIIHMLRRRMGDRSFFLMLHELRRRYEYKTVDTEQFRTLASGFLPAEVPDRSLENFFAHFVYDTGIPNLELQHEVSRLAGKWQVRGKLLQEQVGEGFSIFVPIEIRFAKGKSVTHWLRSDSEGVPIELTFSQQPVKVLLDPQDSVLAVRN